MSCSSLPPLLLTFCSHPLPLLPPHHKRAQGNFSLEVEAGEFTDSEILVMLGENGTGKTTFIRMLAVSGWEGGGRNGGWVFEDCCTQVVLYIRARKSCIRGARPRPFLSLSSS